MYHCETFCTSFFTSSRSPSMTSDAVPSLTISSTKILPSAATKFQANKPFRLFKEEETNCKTVAKICHKRTYTCNMANRMLSYLEANYTRILCQAGYEFVHRFLIETVLQKHSCSSNLFRRNLPIIIPESDVTS